MKEILFKKIDELKDKMISDIVSMVKIDSQRSDAVENCPYGKGCREALDFALELCKREGLYTKDIDGQMVYGSYGKSEEYIGVMGHLDVVETGDGWINPPFSGHIENNCIYSRGALDNKGPIIAAFYGLLALKECGITPKREIRIIFGSNEETGMNDCKYYISNEKPPILGFTPDNKFPAIYGERGRAVVKVSGGVSEIVDFSNEYFMNAKPNGDRLNINLKDEHFGEMQVRNKKLSYDNGIMSITFSLSLPVCDINDILERIKSKAKNLNVELVSFVDYVLHNKDATLVKTLNDAYNEAMNDNLKPTTTTGGTYAHVCHNIIPFGPSFPGQNGIGHQPNEWINIDDIVNCAKVYAYALYKLGELDEIEVPMVNI